MTILRHRLARRIANWKQDLATRRATRHLDDRLREDAGLPPRAVDARDRHLLFPFHDL